MWSEVRGSVITIQRTQFMPSIHGVNMRSRKETSLAMITVLLRKKSILRGGLAPHMGYEDRMLLSMSLTVGCNASCEKVAVALPLRNPEPSGIRLTLEVKWPDRNTCQTTCSETTRGH